MPDVIQKKTVKASGERMLLSLKVEVVQIKVRDFRNEQEGNSIGGIEGEVVEEDEVDFTN